MGSKYLVIKKKIENFNKKINVDGDKSLSIRWLLLASQCIGVSKARNLQSRGCYECNQMS